MSTAAKSKTNIAEVVPFLRVSDIAASIRFYVDGLDARIAARWEPDGELRWCRLELGGTSLMLQTFGPELRERASAKTLGLGMSLASNVGTPSHSITTSAPAESTRPNPRSETVCGTRP
jgi:catechol 2,3-dioxygenase-like lactoylglutathione lyase family enzyme